MNKIILTLVGGAAVFLSCSGCKRKSHDYYDPNYGLQQYAQDRLRPMPVNVTMRKAKMGSGYVVQLKNTGESVFQMKITCGKNVKNLTLNAGESKELGWFEGIPIDPGSSVTVSPASSADHFKNIKMDVPVN